MNSHVKQQTAPVALITGGSAGLGLALSRALAGRGWRVVTDARDPVRLARAAAGIGRTAIALDGDIRDIAHRAALVAAVRQAGRLDLLVHNASTLGPSPLRPLSDLPLVELNRVLETNLVAPVALTRMLLPLLKRDEGALVSMSSDAAVEHYEGWGAYGASKAALDHATLTLGVEGGLRAYAVDPGDMRTQMHQDAFPGEDISDRPPPESVVPHLLALLDARPESGRYRAADFEPATELTGA